MIINNGNMKYLGLEINEILEREELCWGFAVSFAGEKLEVPFFPDMT